MLLPPIEQCIGTKFTIPFSEVRRDNDDQSSHVRPLITPLKVVLTVLDYVGPSYEVLESFLHFSERRIPHVIQQSRRILNLNPDDYNEHNEQHVQLVRTILQEASQDFMSSRREAQAQSLKSIHEQNTPAEEEEEDDTGERTITVMHEKKTLVDRSAVRGTETASYSWNQQANDFTQSPNEAFHQQLPHTSPFVQGHMYNSPTGTLDAPLPQKQVGPSGYDDPSFAYGQFTTENFDHAYLNQPEFLATIEDPEMYGSSSLDANDVGAYEFAEPSYRRER